MKKAIAIFDIGKTNKKFLLFGEKYNVLHEEEIKFPEKKDEDGFPCDDIASIEKWIFQVLEEVLNDKEYDIAGLNFSTYGASLAYIDAAGKRCAPVYNYLKSLKPETWSKFLTTYNIDGDFFRKTASPPLGMLNSGIQAYRLKYEKPELYSEVKHILHFPQYISYLITGKIASEYTSIGCHTAMWDFDNSSYHKWLKKEGIVLPHPLPNNTLYDAAIFFREIQTGIGIHDSSASLVPYLQSGEEFILISSGTWSINMNPFNSDQLTKDELNKDCLCYMSTLRAPVKASRLFMGHYHDANLKRIAGHFNLSEDDYKKVKADVPKLLRWLEENKRVFFKYLPGEDGIDYSVGLNILSNFNEAYNRMMFDLTMLEIESLKLVIPKKDKSNKIYISGGFSRNEIFTRLIAECFNDKEVYVSEISNSSALGAAMALEIFGKEIDLGLNKVNRLKAE